MSDAKTNIYEGLFLFPQSATANLQAAIEHLTDILVRAEADIISLSKWDERRLAYEIKGNKRGVYFLAYLRLDPTKLTGLERDCNLSEHLLRTMLTRADHVPAEVVESAEGRAKLADEIKLRSEEATAAPAPTVSPPTAPPPTIPPAPGAPPAEEAPTAKIQGGAASDSEGGASPAVAGAEAGGNDT